MKKCKKIYVSTVFILISIPIIYVSFERKFEQYHKLSIKSKNEALNVLIIGDSWVAGHKLDSYVAEFLKDYNVDADVFSLGRPGAKSKAIYQDLVTSEILNSSPKYIVVVAGVNDTASHIGKDFYSYHMVLIQKTIIEIGAVPIIIEVPEYDIEHIKRSTLGNVKNFVYRNLFDNGEVNVIQKYRDSLPFLAIKFFTDDYEQDKNLYANPSHLNDEGNKKLSKLIAGYIKTYEHQCYSASSTDSGSL